MLTICKISHEYSKVVDETIEWLPEYESIFEDGSGVMKVHVGKVHKYLGMSLDFSHKGQCHVTMYMYDYLDGILQAFDASVKKHYDGFTPVTRQHFKTLAPNNLFVVNEDCENRGSGPRGWHHFLFFVGDLIFKALKTQKKQTDGEQREAFLLTTQ